MEMGLLVRFSADESHLLMILNHAALHEGPLMKKNVIELLTLLRYSCNGRRSWLDLRLLLRIA
jgi:hypothetical protein